MHFNPLNQLVILPNSAMLTRYNSSFPTKKLSFSEMNEDDLRRGQQAIEDMYREFEYIENQYRPQLEELNRQIEEKRQTN